MCIPLSTVDPARNIIMHWYLRRYVFVKEVSTSHTASFQILTGHSLIYYRHHRQQIDAQRISMSTMGKAPSHTVLSEPVVQFQSTLRFCIALTPPMNDCVQMIQSILMGVEQKTSKT